MDTPTRRDFFIYAVGATLASALPVSAQSHSTKKPLSVDLVGPMAFTMGAGVVDVWLPTLTEHEAGIGTSAGSIAPLTPGDYTITGPSPFLGARPPIYPSDQMVHTEQANQGSVGNNREFRLTLPMPQHIVALSPVRARIYKTNPSLPKCTPSAQCTLCAVGLRLLYDQYDQNGVPTLAMPGGKSEIIPLDVAPFETQVNMSIGYAPMDLHDDSIDSKAREAFNKLSKLIGLDLTVEIETPGCGCPTGGRKTSTKESGPFHNCHGPIILANLV
jgi:hypothetical protein